MNYKRKRRVKPIVVFGRVMLSIGTAIVMLLVAVYSSAVVIAYGPSENMRNRLVLSALEASATKWAPYLVLPKSRVKKIMADSKKTTVDETDVSNLDSDKAKNIQSDDNGLKLVYFTKPRFRGYLLIVDDASRIKVGVSSENFSTAVRGARIFDIAKKYNCIAAINGGEFSDIGGQGSGAAPMGLTFSFGKKVWSDSLTRTFIGFDSQNKLICTEGMTSKRAEELGIRDAVSFQNGNVLISSENGKVKLFRADNDLSTSQRTAIGQTEDGTVLMLVTDGRTGDSMGATRNEVIDILVEYGAVNAAMLDGGSSAMLYYRNYFDVYGVDKSTLDEYQLQGLVNKYKAFVPPRTIPTYFIVTD